MAPLCSTRVTFGTLVPLEEDSTYTSLFLLSDGDAELLEASAILNAPNLKSLVFMKSTTDLRPNMSSVSDNLGDLGGGKNLLRDLLISWRL